MSPGENNKYCVECTDDIIVIGDTKFVKFSQLHSYFHHILYLLLSIPFLKFTIDKEIDTKTEKESKESNESNERKEAYITEPEKKQSKKEYKIFLVQIIIEADVSVNPCIIFLFYTWAVAVSGEGHSGDMSTAVKFK